MKKLTILVVHNYYQKRGGEDFVFEEETTALKEAGHVVITYSVNNSKIKEFGIYDKIRYISSFFLKKKFNDLKQIIKKNKIDIAHVHNVFPLITPYIYAFLKKNNIKVVQTLHNYRFLCPNGLFYVNNKVCTKCINTNFRACIYNKCYKDSIIHSFLYSHIIKKCQKSFRNDIDALIALTDFTKELFVKAGFDENKIFVKGNGLVDPKIRRKKSKKYFLYIGRLSQEKGIDFLLESFAKLPEFNLYVAGIGEKLGEYKQKYNSRNIKFLGFISGKDKDNIISMCEAIILPSLWYENYPLSIIDGFSRAMPVIGSNIGGISRIINDKKTGLLFEPNDFVSLKKSLQKFTSDPSIRERIGDEARKYFELNNKLDNNIKRLVSIYRKVLK